MRSISRSKRSLAVIFAACLTIVAVVTQPSTAAAQDNGFNIITSPLPMRLTAKPGDTVTTELRVKNSGSQLEHLKVGLMKFGASKEEGRPLISDRGPGDDYFDWVSFSPSEFEAKPDQWITVKMTIKVPKSAGLEYYYAVTFARSSNAATKDTARVIGKSASLVLLHVKNSGEKPTLQLTEFSTERKMNEYLPVKFKARVRNSGNVFLSPQGNIFISRGSQQVATLPVNDAGGTILPSTSRGFDSNWKDGFPVYVDKLVDDKPVKNKDGSLAQQLQWDFDQVSKLRIGKYSAHLVMVYNDGTHDVPMEATVSFWVMPWRLILLALLILILPAALVYVLMRRRIRKAMRNGNIHRIEVHHGRRPGGSR